MGLETTHILAIVNGYNGKEGLQEAAEMIQTLLKNTLTRTEEQLLTLNNGYPHENIFTLLILSVCFLCANISGRAQNKFSDMEVNHVRVATPGLFPRRIVSCWI